MTADNAASAGVVDLVGINQTRVQAMLMGASQGDQAPSLLLAWHQVVDSAADLWSALPPTTAPAQLLMERLTGLSGSLHDSMQRAPWPIPAQTDEKMHALAETFTQAAGLIHAGRGQLSHADADQVRAAVAATMLLGAHAVRIVANHYVAEAATLARNARRRRHPHSDLVAESADRLYGFEQIAGAAAGGLYHSRPDAVATSADRELAVSLAEWQIQSHRTLARHPATANLFMIAQTHARIGKLAGAVFHSRAVTGGADLDDLSKRVLPPLEDATAGWLDLTAEWHFMLAGDAYQHLDPKLLRASHRIRAVTDQLIGGPTGRADPAYALAFAIDVRQACPAMQDSLAHGSALARSIRDATNASESTIRGPARHLANRAVTLAGDDIAWVDPRALNRNHLITLPRPVREHIGAACDNIAVQTSRVLAGSAILRLVQRPAATHAETPARQPAGRRQPSEATRPTPAPHPGR
jgi:hypothetical protein